VYLARANQETRRMARKRVVERRPDERRAPRLEQSALELRVPLPSASSHRFVSGHPRFTGEVRAAGSERFAAVLVGDGQGLDRPTAGARSVSDSST